MTRNSRSAFSLSELMVILALLAVLSAMFFPAIMKLRGMASRSVSQNNMKQIAIAVHNYESVNAKLPPGVDANNYSAQVYLLPFIEQDQVYQLVDLKKSVDDEANAKIAKTIIKIFESPRDPQKQVSADFPGTNYLFNAGSKPSLTDNDGVFYRGSDAVWTLAKISSSDGTSNTLMTVETLKGDGSDKATDVRRQHVKLDKASLRKLSDDSGVDDFKNGKHIAGNRCANWMDGRFLQGTFTATRTPNDDKPDVDCGGEGGLMSPRSLDGFILIGMMDGSVRGVDGKKLDAKLWKALSTVAGGEEIPPDFDR
jgi:type II secretory pathway pseudopilin PulG